MSTSLYDVSVGTYVQILDATSSVLAKGRAHFEENGTDLDEIVSAQLYPDMLPFSFQINSVMHHSLGALKAIQSGVFRPPPALPEMEYQGLQDLVTTARAGLNEFTAETVNAFKDKDVVFKLKDLAMPFTGEGFILSFSLPNFYFHATTTYDMLRMRGVPLSKRDFMGRPRLNM